MIARNPREVLADARIRVAQLERELSAARIAEAEAEVEVVRAELLERAPTTRPPAPAPERDSSPEIELVDGGWL